MRDLRTRIKKNEKMDTRAIIVGQPYKHVPVELHQHKDGESGFVPNLDADRLNAEGEFKRGKDSSSRDELFKVTIEAPR